MASPAAAVTYHPYSKSITGASVSGHWWDEGGRTYIDGYLKDTACDGGNSYFLARFSSKATADRVNNTQGCNTSKYFRFSAATASDLDIKLGAQNWPIWDRNTGWIDIK